MNPRKTAVLALVRTEKDSCYSNIVIGDVLSRSGLDARDKSFASKLFYGVIEKSVTLDYIINLYSKQKAGKLSYKVKAILRSGLFQLIYMDKVPDSAAVNESVKLAKSLGEQRASGFINAVLRAFLRDGKKIKYPQDKLLKKSIEYSCPVSMITRWEKAYGEYLTQGILKSLEGRPPLTIRVNKLKISADELIQNLEKDGVYSDRIPWLENALSLENTGDITNLDAYSQGLFHVQDAASQFLCSLLSPKDGELVFDVCAAPGGKSFTLAQYGGQIHSFDIHEHKIRLINDGAKRLGIGNLISSIRDASQSGKKLPPADKVLCDVPCSGLGVIRRKPEIKFKSDQEIDAMPLIQYKILCQSAHLLKKGGIIFYSTCSLNPDENNGIIDKFLNENDEFEPLSLNVPEEIRKINEKECEITLFPDSLGTDGFYIASLRRKI